MKKSVNQSFLADVQDSVEFKVEGIKLDFTEKMLERMEELNISRSQLAEKLGVKPSYITKILRGSHNFTIESMVKISDILDCDFGLNLIPANQPHKKSSQKLRMEKRRKRRALVRKKKRAAKNSNTKTSKSFHKVTA